MREVTDANTGEVLEVDNIAEGAELIERPPYWRRHYHHDEGSDVGPEFLEDLLKAQIEMGSIIEADSSNNFNESKYTSLGYLLAKIKPILNKYNFIISYGVGRLNIRTDTTLPIKAFLPVYIRLVHVKTGQYEKFPFDVPMAKFDIQSYGALLTYGRRYATEAYLGLKGGADTDGVGVSQDLAPEDLQKILAAMLKKIEACQTPLDLRTWHKQNEQQIALLGEGDAGRLKEVWQKRLEAVKPAVAKKEGKASDATR